MDDRSSQIVFYSNHDLKIPLPHMNPYLEIKFNKIKKIVEHNKKKFDTTMMKFSPEYTIVLKDLVESHFWLI